MRKGRYLPVLSSFGLYLFCAGAVIPLLGTVLNLKLDAVLLSLGLYLTSILFLFVRELSQLPSISDGITIEIEAPSHLDSGKQGEIAIVLKLKNKQSKPLQVDIVPNFPIGVEPLEYMATARIEDQGREAQIKFAILPLVRGEVVWDGAEIRIFRSRWLAEWQVSLSFNKEKRSIIGPRIQYSTKQRKTPGARGYVGKRFARYPIERGQGGFDSLRKYAVGDDLRRIDWKRSARFASLVVKKFRPDTHQRVCIALDCGRRMSAVVNGRLKLDYGVDAAANLITAANKSGDEVGFFAFHHEVVAKRECSHSHLQERRILSDLVNLKPGDLESNYSALKNWVSVNKKRSLMLLITSISSPISFDEIERTLSRALKHHLPIVVALQDEELERIITSPADSLAEAYIISAAQEQREELEQRVKILSRRGIKCQFTKVAEVAECVEEIYREIKGRGVL